MSNSREPIPHSWLAVVGIAALLACIAVSLLAPDVTTRVTIIVVGAVVALVLLTKRGTLRLDEGGVDIDWFSAAFSVRSINPIATVIPEQWTNSTTDAEAIVCCDAARAIIKSLSAPVEGGAAPGPEERAAKLREAMALFVKAAQMDQSYWEPRINIANIFAIRGELAKAQALASEIRQRYADVLAYAKATLIMAKVAERRIAPDAPPSEVRATQREIMALLRESLERCRGHMATRVSLVQAALRAEAPKAEFDALFAESCDYQGFRDELKKAIVAEGLIEALKAGFPAAYERVFSHPPSRHAA